MLWRKKGLIYKVSGEHYWNKTHAQVPVVDTLDDRLRIYYATRDESGKSRISFIEVDKLNPSKVLYTHNQPILDMGKLGAFDDSGVMPSCIITIDGKKYLYYIGWTTRGTVPYHNSVGLASSEDGISFERSFEGPIINTNQLEPYFSGTSFVIKDKDLFKMWYLSCTEWIEIEGKIEPKYDIKYAESDDGLFWRQNGTVAIPLQDDEGGIVSASVVKENGEYKMWYGVRKMANYRANIRNSYRIGYAESTDGKSWDRLDSKSGIELATTGWDSEMISYPYVILQENRLIMFYNGNGFGKSGFGYAERSR